jgi:diguanylate cyclase (GGDEF)-like protein/PAS domain S-box-containing protein
MDDAINKKAKILVVDDRQENLIAMKKVLKKVNADVTLVDSGEKALDAVLEEKFALILLDVQMPDMDGFETATFLHRNKATAAIPIIFVTAINKDFKYITKGYQVGAVDYLPKPIVAEILISKVQVFITIEENRNKLEQLTNKLYMLSKRQNLLLENAQEGIIGIDEQGFISFINPKGCEILQVDDKLAINKHISSYLFAEDANNLENKWKNSEIYNNCFIKQQKFKSISTLVRLETQEFPAEYNIAPLITEKKSLEGAVLVFQDITKRKQMEDKLIQMAKYDSLTGLANRILFKEFLTASLARSKRRKKTTAVMFLDLDNFKGINDSLGHDAGDLLLQNVANILNKCVRHGDMVARLGGDEFAVILDDVSKPEDTILVAEKILTEFKQPHNLGKEQRIVGTSIGIAVDDIYSENSDSIIKKADLAMYKAKNKGKSTYCLYA